METFVGYIKTPKDALVIFEACRKGLLSRVQRRLTQKERINIHSGSVFAWDEREAGMRRWTDGRTWSPSRVLGSFLTYKELDTKRRPRRPTGTKQAAFSYKHNGLIKQSFSICTASNQKIHLISYYSKSDVLSGKLKRPCHDPILNAIEVPKGLYPELNPLDIGGGHSASMHSIIQRHNSIDSTSTISSRSSSIAPSLSSSTSPQSSEDDFNEQLSSLNTCHSPSVAFIAANGLPIQDIAWDRLPSSEDKRQLNAIWHTVRI
jgi:hypothetical protein